MERKNKPKRHKGLYHYFDEHNVWGQPEEIREAAKRLYRKQYKANWKKEYREKNREFSICFPHQLAVKIEAKAKEHNRSLSEMVRDAVESYFTKNYIVPNEAQVAQIELTIRDCLNQLIQMRYLAPEAYTEYRDQYQRIERRIIELEEEIKLALRKPKTMEEIIQSEISLSTSTKASLLAIIAKDNADQD